MPTYDTLRKRTLKLDSSNNAVGIYDRLVQAKQQRQGTELDLPPYDPNLEAPKRSMAYRINQGLKRLEEL